MSKSLKEEHLKAISVALTKVIASFPKGSFSSAVIVVRDGEGNIFLTATDEQDSIQLLGRGLMIEMQSQGEAGTLPPGYVIEVSDQPPSPPRNNSDKNSN